MIGKEPQARSSKNLGIMSAHRGSMCTQCRNPRVQSHCVNREPLGTTRIILADRHRFQRGAGPIRLPDRSRAKKINSQLSTHKPLLLLLIDCDKDKADLG